jgi:urease accessory protein
VQAEHLYRLAAWLSPAFPVGAYSYSHGLEFAVEAGLVRDRESLASWAEMIVLRGSGHLDAVLFREAWRAGSRKDMARLRRLAQMAAAFRGTSEMALESAAQGEAFLRTVQNSWGIDVEDIMGPGASPVPYSVALGAVCGREQIALDLALQMFLQAFVGNLVSAGVRLIPLGQTDGQRVIAELESTVRHAVLRARETPLEEVGTSTPIVDWTSMQHETQQTRLFRS